MQKESKKIWPEGANEQTINSLENFVANGDSMPQAYLFLNQFDGKPWAASFATLITGQGFPNVDTVQFDASGDVGVEGIREILQLGALRPVGGIRKVIVLDNMEQASVQMLNALLKTLEEPSPHAVYILLSKHPLLATVMSRCQVINLSQTSSTAETSPELTQALQLLEDNKAVGLAERLALVNTLAALDDELLPQVLENWLRKQVQVLKQEPQKYLAVRNTMETIQALRGNFNKKMVLQSFVTTGLV